MMSGYGCCATLRLECILAVELNSFAAVSGDHQVTLHWFTASETGNDHFNIVRDGETTARIPSQGNGASGHEYTWIDYSVTNDVTYAYSLLAVDVNGNHTTLASASATPSADIVSEYGLHPNFPNPFNPTTTFSYAVKEAGCVKLTIYDLTGRMVKELVNTQQPIGRYTVNFDGTGLPSGIYYYRLSVNGFSATHKMALVK